VGLLSHSGSFAQNETDSILLIPKDGFKPNESDAGYVGNTILAAVNFWFRRKSSLRFPDIMDEPAMPCADELALKTVTARATGQYKMKIIHIT